MEHKFKRWAVLASQFVAEHFDQCEPLLSNDHDEMDNMVSFVSNQLYLSCQTSTESSLMLLQQGQEWDAEIINRTIIDGTVKYLFMFQGTDEEVIKKVKEYWEILPSYSSIKRSDKINSILNVIDSEILHNSQAINDLRKTKHEKETIHKETNQKHRRSLEGKWAFSNIIDDFNKSNDEDLLPLIQLSHSFGMGSHFIHKDGCGVAMMWERSIRNRERQELVKVAHVARLISDLCSLAEIRTMALHKRCNKPYEFSKQIRESYSSLFFEFKVASDKLNQVEYGS